MTLSQVVLLVFVGFLALFGLAALGTLLPARPYRAHHEKSQPGPPTPLVPGLPAPVERHFRETLGQAPPRIETAVIWGRGRIQLRGLWLPMRFKAWYKPGRSFFRALEFTFYTRPFLRGNEYFLKGHGLFEIGGDSDTGPTVDQSQNLALWAEAVWAPSILVHPPAPQWEPVDDTTARLVIPFQEYEDSILAHFDPESGCMTHLSAMRYRSNSGEKEPWRADLLEWKDYEGLSLPCKIAVAWGDPGSAWSYWDVDGVAFNVDVNEKLKG
jgi:hypothetical protein